MFRAAGLLAIHTYTGFTTRTNGRTRKARTVGKCVAVQITLADHSVPTESEIGPYGGPEIRHVDQNEIGALPTPISFSDLRWPKHASESEATKGDWDAMT